MTGYGSAKGNAAGFEVSIEIKSVNKVNERLFVGDGSAGDVDKYHAVLH